MRRWLKPNRGLLALACWAVMAAPASAASYEDRSVAQVDLRGLRVTARETLFARIQTKPGQPYKDRVVSEDIRRIFALGYFNDVKVEVEELPDGLLVVFVVKEKPAISEIELEGARYVPKSRILELLGLKTGELYDPRKVKEGIDVVRAEYIRRGFSQAEIVSEVEVDPATEQAKLRVLVDEGPHIRIVQVLVEGNQAFPDKRIRKVLKTKRRWWFFRGAYNAQVLEDDLERVRAFYRKHGYQDADVTHTVYRDPSGRGLYVHLKITEGLQHRVGQVALEGVTLFPEREILRVVTLKPGAVYSQEALQEDLRLIKQYYGDRGYIRAEVAPDPQLDAQTKRVQLTYRITEGRLMYVNRVDVQGNLRTKDVVVRRDLRIYPGDQFDGAKIRKSIDRLYNLGFFEEVNVDTEPAPGVADHEDLVLKVKEAKTGSLSFGGGFSSVDRLVAMVELEQRNFDIKGFPHFTGAGQDLRFRIEAGTVRRYFDLSFTEPWIFGHPVSLGLDAYNRTRLRSRDLGLAYEEEQRGAGIRLGKELFDMLRLGAGYQLFRTEISDVVDEASADLKAEQGRNTVSVGNLNASFDTRDNRFDPTKGYFIFSSVDLAGGPFAGDKDFFRLQGGASYYQPHWDGLVFEARTRAGIVDAYGDSDEVPIFERFFGGGSGTIRGFEERRVGPRDPLSNDPIGGEAIFIATVEEVVTIVKDERGKAILRGSVFFDAGDVWRRLDEFGESFKTGTGIGARVNTPLGPLRLDIGWPVTKPDGEDRKMQFHFNLSRSF